MLFIFCSWIRYVCNDFHDKLFQSYFFLPLYVYFFFYYLLSSILTCLLTYLLHSFFTSFLRTIYSIIFFCIIFPTPPQNNFFLTSLTSICFFLLFSLLDLVPILVLQEFMKGRLLKSIKTKDQNNSSSHSQGMVLSLSFNLYKVKRKLKRSTQSITPQENKSIVILMDVCK